MAWNYGDVYEAVADKTPPGTPALIHAGPGGTEGRTIMWDEYMVRTNRLARAFLDAGLEYGDKVAHYMRWATGRAGRRHAREIPRNRPPPWNRNYRRCNAARRRDSGN